MPFLFYGFVVSNYTDAVKLLPQLSYEDHRQVAREAEFENIVYRAPDQNPDEVMDDNLPETILNTYREMIFSEEEYTDFKLKIEGDGKNGEIKLDGRRQFMIGSSGGRSDHEQRDHDCDGCDEACHECNWCLSKMLLVDQICKSFEVEHTDFSDYDLAIPRIQNFLVGFKHPVKEGDLVADSMVETNIFEKFHLLQGTIEKVLEKKVTPMMFVLRD
jgi:hypothetical protein